MPKKVLITFLLLLLNTLFCCLSSSDSQQAFAQEIDFLRDIIVPEKGILKVEFSRDSSKLLTTNTNLSSISWDTKSTNIFDKFDISNAHYNSDARYIIGLSSMGIPRIWDVSTKSLLIELAIPDEGMTEAKFSPDDRYIVTASKNSNVYIWDTKTFKLKYTLKGHKEDIRQIVFSPDGQLFATSSLDNSIIVWNVETGQFVEKLVLNYIPTNIEFRPDGKKILVLDLFNKLYIWDFNEKSYVKILENDISKNLITYEISPNRNIMVVCKLGGNLEFINYETNDYLKKMNIGTINVMNICFSPDSKMMTLLLKDGSIQVRKVNTGELVYNYKVCSEEKCYKKINSLCLSSDYNFNLLILNDNNIQLWNNKSGQLILNTMMEPSNSNGLPKYSPDSKYLSVMRNKKVVQVFDTPSGKVVYEIKEPVKNITDIEFSQDSNYLAMSYEDSHVNIWDLTTGRIFKSFNISSTSKNEENNSCYPEDFSWTDISSDNKVLALKNTCDHVYLWDILSGKLLKDITEPIDMQPGFNDFRFSDDNTKLIFNVFMPQKKVYKEMEINSGKIVNEYIEFYNNRNVIETAKYSHNGNYILVGFGDGNINLYDANTYQQIREYKGHKDSVNKLEFSYNDKFFLSVSEDKKAILWEIASGKQIKVFSNNDNEPLSAIFSPDGEYILMTFITSYPKLWRVSSNLIGNNSTLQTNKTEESLKIKANYNPNERIDSILKDYTGINQTALYKTNKLNDPQKVNEILKNYQAKMLSADYIFAKYLPIYQKKQFEMEDINEKDIISNSRKCICGYSTKLTSKIKNQPYELYIVSAIENKFREIEVQKSNKPIVLFIYSKDENFWSIDLKPEANLKEVIIAGNRYQKIQNLSNKNIKVSYVYDVEGPDFWEKLDGNPLEISNEYKTFIQSIRNITGLIESSYQSSLPYKNFTVPYYSLEISDDSKYKIFDQYGYRYDKACQTDNIPYSCSSSLGDRRELPDVYKDYPAFNNLNQLISELQDNKKLAKYIPEDYLSNRDTKMPDVTKQNISYNPSYIYQAQSNCCCFSNPNSAVQILVIGKENTNNLFYIDDGDYILLGGNADDILYFRDMLDSLIYPGKGNDYIGISIRNSIVFFDQSWGNDVIKDCEGSDIQLDAGDLELKWNYDNSIVFGKGIYPKDMIWINDIYVDKNTAKMFVKGMNNYNNRDSEKYEFMGSLYYNIKTGDSIEFINNNDPNLNFIFYEN